MNVAFHGGEDDLAPSGRIGPLQVLLEMAYGGLHRFSGLRPFGSNQFIVEQPTYFARTRHQRSDDEVQRHGSVSKLCIEVGYPAIFRGLDDLQEDAIEDFVGSSGDSEGDVRDGQNGFDVRDLLFDEAD